MPSHFAPQWGSWLELLLVLGLGATLLVAFAAAADRWVRSAVAERTLWQVATLGLFALVAMELTGAGSGLTQLVLRQLRPAEAAPHPAAISPVPRTDALQVAIETSDLPEAWDSLDSIEPALAVETGQVPGGMVGLPNHVPGAATHADGDLSCATASQKQWHTAEVTAPMGRYTSTAGQTGHHAERGRGTHAPPCIEENSESPGTWWPAIVWAIGAAAIVVRMAWSRWLLLVFRRRCRPVCDLAMQRRVDLLARRLGIRGHVQLLTAPRLGSPVAFGIFRPVVLVPAGFDADFDRGQQEAMLAHELAHLASRDPVWQAAATWLVALLWWQPLAWWSRRRLRAASESAADEASLLVPDGPCVLAASLVTLGRRLVKTRSLGWLSIEGGGFRSGLGRRVERLLSLRRRTWRAPRRARLALAHASAPLALALAAILGTAWVPSQVPFSEGGAVMSVFVSSWRHSLTATVLAAALAPATVPAQERERPKDAAPPAAREPGAPERGAREAAAPERAAREPGAPERAAREPGAREAGGRETRAREAGARDAGAREAPDAQQEAKIREIQAKRQALQEKATEIHKQMESLKPGSDAEAKQLQEKMKAVQEEMRQLVPPPGAGGPEDRVGIRHRMEDLKEAFKRARDAGNNDEAARIRKQAEQLIPGLRERGSRSEGEARQGEKVRPEPPADMKERIQHLQAAAENLRAAGLKGEADHVMQTIQALGLGRVLRDRGGPEGGPRPEGRQGPGGGPGRVQELQSEIQQMRQEMQELREQVKHLVEQQQPKK